MRSLTNKTANIKYKKLISLQNSVRATESHIQNSKNLFLEKLMKRTDGFFISSFYQLFWKKKIFAVLYIWLSRSYTVL